MNDRELLELAAKAAALSVEWDGDGFVRPVPFKGFINYEAWNPLADDGDALRLAVKLFMTVVINDHEVEIYCYDHSVECLASISAHGYELGEVTRHAIVHAAAEIGKAMP